jgi:stage II sporulation protein AA (anti-sigma F factor antagonist)
MLIDETIQDGVHILAPAGRIDTTTSGSLEDALRRAVDDGARSILVDFAAVDYISSAGLRVFLVLAKRLKDERGRLVLCSLPQPVRQVFHLAGFMPLFKVEPSREAALASLSTSP